MEALIAMLILIGVIVVAVKNMGDTPPGRAVPVTDPEPPSPGLTFVRTVTATADTPGQLTREIDNVCRQYTGRFFNSHNYVLGAPQITADGRTAYISLFR